MEYITDILELVEVVAQNNFFPGTYQRSVDLEDILDCTELVVQMLHHEDKLWEMIETEAAGSREDVEMIPGPQSSRLCPGHISVMM